MEKNKITRLAVQKKNPKRVNVYLDDSFAFGLLRETAAWLEKGQILSDEKIKELLETDQKNEVYNKALDFISYKPRSVQETYKKLHEAGFDEAVIHETLSKLSENGLLNDRIYAQNWVAERMELKPKSRRALEYELRKKGIPDRLIQSAVEDVDDFQAALEVAESRLSRFEGLPKFEFRKKMGNFLAGKGFSYDIISEVTQIMWNKIQSSTESF